MGIDLATWRARIGLNHCQCRYACRSLPVQWKAAGWGVKEAVNSTPLVFQGRMAVVSLSLILEYAFCRCRCPKATSGCGPKLRSGSLHSHSGEARRGSTVGVGSGISLLLQVGVVVLALLLMAGDVERNPGPTGKEDQVDKLLPTVDDSPLGEDDLRDVLWEITPVAASWRAIGIGFGLNFGILARIKEEHGCLKERMTAVLECWLNKNYEVERFGEPTWRTVVKVVGHSAGGEKPSLASEIAKKHPVIAAATPQTCREDSSSSTVSSSSIESEGCQVPSTKESQPARQAESLSPTKVMEEIEKLRMQLKMESDFKIHDLKAANQQLQMKTEEQEHRIQDLEAAYQKIKREEQEHRIQDPEAANQQLQMKVVEHIIQVLEAVNQRIKREEQEHRIQDLEAAHQQLRMKIEEQEHRIQDLEAANQQIKKEHRIQDQEAVNQQLQMKVEHRIQDLEAVNQQLQLKTEEQERRIQDLERLQLKTGKDKAAQEKELKPDAASNFQSAPSGGEQCHDRSKVSVQREAFGGYDCKFIEPPPRVYPVKCPVCHLKLRDPYESTCCGYNFCYTCSQQVQRSNSPCPWCRKEKFEVKENKSMKRFLNQLEVFCTYSKNGCRWRGYLGELQDHLDRTDHSNYERPTNKSPPCEQDNKSTMEWKQKNSLPVEMNSHHIVRIGNNVYCGGGITGKVNTDRLVFKYDCKEDKWSELPECPSLHFGLTKLDEKLVTVGGRDTNALTPIKDVYALDEDTNSWKNFNIPLSIARCSPCVVTYKSVLVVCGGIVSWRFDYEHPVRTDIVEVFQDPQWHTSVSLPFALSAMSCAIINDKCYVIGGKKQGGLPNRQACFISVSSLILTYHPESSGKHSPSSPQWEFCNCPMFSSTAAELEGHLLAIGGKDTSNDSSAAVHKYLPSTNSWERIANGTLPKPKYKAAAIRLEGGDIIIVGGKDKPDSVDKTVYIGSKHTEK